MFMLACVTHRLLIYEKTEYQLFQKQSSQTQLLLILGFRRDYEICVFLGYYAASCLPTFRENVSVPPSRVNSLDSWPVKMEPIRCPETSVNNYPPRNIPEECRSQNYFYYKKIISVFTEIPEIFRSTKPSSGNKYYKNVKRMAELIFKDAFFSINSAFPCIFF
jgi:hypothetical protein